MSQLPWIVRINGKKVAVTAAGLAFDPATGAPVQLPWWDRGKASQLAAVATLAAMAVVRNKICAPPPPLPLPRPGRRCRVLRGTTAPTAPRRQQ